MDNVFLANYILAVTYIFVVVPAIGRLAVLGATTKKYWVGYKYEACMERGFTIHIGLGCIAVIIWAVSIRITDM